MAELCGCVACGVDLPRGDVLWVGHEAYHPACLPRTPGAVLDAVLGSRRQGKGKGGWDEATPTRIIHLAQLLHAATEVGDDAAADAIEEAEQRLNASGWLQIPAREVTAELLADLLRRRPWDPPGAEQGAATDHGQLFLPGVPHG